jgi:hypothetical protein
VAAAVNDGGRSCTARGAPLTRRSAAATAVRARIAPVPPPPRPLRRFLNRSGGRSTANRSRNWSGPGSAPAPR